MAMSQFKVAFFSHPPQGWTVFPTVGYERDGVLSFAKVNGTHVGKCGRHLGWRNGCCFGVDSREEFVIEDSYEQLYMNGPSKIGALQ